MGPIDIAVAQMKFKIPRRILEAVFVRYDGNWREAPESIDEAIMAAVIRPRVLVMMDLIGGTEAIIPISGADHKRYNDYTSVYRFPKDMTGGRSILSVLNVTFADPVRANTYGMGSMCGSSTVMQAGQAVMNSHAAIPITSTAKIQVIGENTVMVRDSVVLPANVFLRCILANDSNMSHIQIRSYRPFIKLVEFAVKSYIFNEYILEMDVAELKAGQALGRFKEVIDGYADAEENFEEHLTTVMAKVSFMNDGETYGRHLKSLIGGYR